MTKQEYINSLEEIVVDEILITVDTRQLEEEMATNFWSIAANEDLTDQITIDDLLNLFDRVKQNRSIQLNQSDLEIDLIFYLWFDEQACQLRFNLINSSHKNLPFGAEINFAETVDEIIRDFLNSTYHDGIPSEELKDVPTDSDEEIQDETTDIVKVYKEILKKEKRKHNV